MAAAAARPPPPPPPTMVIQDDYIDMDLTPTATPLPPASPRFEFQSAAAGVDAASRRREGEAALASPADELFYKGNLLPLHLPPRLQLVQRLLQEQTQTQTQHGVKRDAESRLEAEAGDDDGAAASKVLATKKPSWSKRLKVVKRWASREYIRSLFLATRPSDIVVDGGTGTGSVSARGAPPAAAALESHDEVCHHRKSFSGIIRRVRLVVSTTKAAPAPPGVSPLCSSSSSSSSSTPSCANANGFFFRTACAAPMPTLKRSSSAGSEEGAIQGAIAHCKRSQQLQGTAAARRSSAGDVVFYCVTNTPRASSVAAGEVAPPQERQEMCRG